MVFTLMEIAGAQGPIVAPKSYSQAQPFPGIMNENRIKDSSIYPWVLPGSWALGFNLVNFINSQLI